MYTAIHLPTPGKAEAATALAAALGNKIIGADGTEYRLVRATAAIANAANLVVQFALDSGGAFTWEVGLPAADDDDRRLAVIPHGQTGSDGSTTVLAGDYFLAIVRGPCRFVAHAAITPAAGQLLRPKTTGRVSGTATAQNHGTVLVATQAAAAAGDTLRGYIISL